MQTVVGKVFLVVLFAVICSDACNIQRDLESVARQFFVHTASLDVVSTTTFFQATAQTCYVDFVGACPSTKRKRKKALHWNEDFSLQISASNVERSLSSISEISGGQNVVGGQFRGWGGRTFPGFPRLFTETTTNTLSTTTLTSIISTIYTRTVSLTVNGCLPDEFTRCPGSPIDPLPSQCRDYQVLDEMDRSSTVGAGTNADNLTPPGNGMTSPDWQGSGWYRMQAPAGTIIPESVVAMSMCGTVATGWMMDTHPTDNGVPKDVTFCFNNIGDQCWRMNSGQVTLCNDFYVYYLPDTDAANQGRLRYCAEL